MANKVVHIFRHWQLPYFSIRLRFAFFAVQYAEWVYIPTYLILFSRCTHVGLPGYLLKISKFSYFTVFSHRHQSVPLPVMQCQYHRVSRPASGTLCNFERSFVEARFPVWLELWEPTSIKDGYDLWVRLIMRYCQVQLTSERKPHCQQNASIRTWWTSAGHVTYVSFGCHTPHYNIHRHTA